MFIFALLAWNPSSGFANTPECSNKRLTRWGRVTYICVSKLTIMDSDKGLSPFRCHEIIWFNAGILSIGPLGKNFNEIVIEINTGSFKKRHLKMPSRKWRPIWLGLIVIFWRIMDLAANADRWHMMTSSNGNIFRIINHLCGEFTGDRWIPSTKASDAELWCFLIGAGINGWVNNR